MNIKRAAAALAAILMALTVSTPAQAAGEFVLFAQHPSIAAQPEYGKTISDLAVMDNELYMGYGNYSANTGPIDIATANLTTGVTGVKATANTEEINTYRTFNGKLYAPWIDPTIVGGLYSSNQNGTWEHFGTDVENVHIFDVAVLPNGVQVAVGSANSTDRTRFLGATAFVSRDNGRTWTPEMHDLTSAKDPNVSGYERYYWVAVINGKAYMQARDISASYGQAIFPLRIFDGTNWTKANKSADCFETTASDVEVFNNKAYCGNGRVFSGSKATTRGGIYATDFYQYNGSLYALSSGKIMKLNRNTWTQIGVAPSGAASLAVTSTHIYIGTSAGTVYRSTV